MPDHRHRKGDNKQKVFNSNTSFHSDPVYDSPSTATSSSPNKYSSEQLLDGREYNNKNNKKQSRRNSNNNNNNSRTSSSKKHGCYIPPTIQTLPRTNNSKNNNHFNFTLDLQTNDESFFKIGSYLLSSISTTATTRHSNNTDNDHGSSSFQSRKEKKKIINNTLSKNEQRLFYHALKFRFQKLPTFEESTESLYAASVRKYMATLGPTLENMVKAVERSEQIDDRNMYSTAFDNDVINVRHEARDIIEVRQDGVVNKCNNNKKNRLRSKKPTPPPHHQYNTTTNHDNNTIFIDSQNNIVHSGLNNKVNSYEKRCRIVKNDDICDEKDTKFNAAEHAIGIMNNNNACDHHCNNKPYENVHSMNGRRRVTDEMRRQNDVQETNWNSSRHHHYNEEYSMSATTNNCDNDKIKSPTSSCFERDQYKECCQQQQQNTYYQPCLVSDRKNERDKPLLYRVNTDFKNTPNVHSSTNDCNDGRLRQNIVEGAIDTSDYGKIKPGNRREHTIIDENLEMVNVSSTLPLSSPRNIKKDLNISVSSSPRKSSTKSPQFSIEDDVLSKLNESFDSFSEEENENRKVLVKGNALVRAPKTLPGNYLFEARLGDEIFLALVPIEGVVEGQVFESKKISFNRKERHEPGARIKKFMDMNSPQGRWRDDIFDCLNDGITHPMLLLSIFCPLISLYQIMARLQRNRRGQKVDQFRDRAKVRDIIWFTVAIAFLHCAFLYIFFSVYFNFGNEKLEMYLIYSGIPMIIIDVVIMGYFYFMLCNTREVVRKEHSISELRCKGCEDTCMSLLFPSCVLSQMGRHTSDNDTFLSFCCTDTGLPDHIEVKLPSDFRYNIPHTPNEVV